MLESVGKVFAILITSLAFGIYHRAFFQGFFCDICWGCIGLCSDRIFVQVGIAFALPEQLYGGAD